MSSLLSPLRAFVFIAHRVYTAVPLFHQLFMLVDLHRSLLFHALALSASHFFSREKVPTGMCKYALGGSWCHEIDLSSYAVYPLDHTKETTAVYLFLLLFYRDFLLSGSTCMIGGFALGVFFSNAVVTAVFISCPPWFVPPFFLSRFLVLAFPVLVDLHRFLNTAYFMSLVNVLYVPFVLHVWHLRVCAFAFRFYLWCFFFS